jgi:DNA-directed RNA polymerase III subunit RPC3
LSYLNRRQVSSGLVILVQQHLVAHSAADVDPTFYEINWQQSYGLVRCGRISKLVEDRFGKQEANVFSKLYSLGHTQIVDLKKLYLNQDDDEKMDANTNGGVAKGASTKRARDGMPVNGTNGKTNGTATSAPTEFDDTKPALEINVNGDGVSNGIHSVESNHAATEDGGEILSEDAFYEALNNLIRKGWIMRVEELQFLSAGDFHELARQVVIPKHCKGPEPHGPNEKKNVARDALSEKRRMRDAWLEQPQCLGQKRKINGDAYGESNKRVKINGANRWSNGNDSGSVSTDDQLVIRVNPEKIAVAMRTEQLVSLVEQRLGPITARIYRVMLDSLEDRISRCFDEWADPLAPKQEDDGSLRIFTLHISKQEKIKLLDICEGLDPNAVCTITGRTLVKDKEKPENKVLNQPVDPLSLNPHHRLALVEKHIDLLTHDPFHFATWVGRGECRIDFEEIAKALIQYELENTVSARKGALGVKLIRALLKKGKLDERQTCNVMMLSANDIRGMINDLTMQGFVQTQEIPKVDRREAKHSIHLIWYDRQRAREKLLQDTYKGMVRIMQRLAFEREKMAPLLAKAERTDVAEDKERYLNEEEIAALKKWYEVQKKLYLQLFREDELVATLRDFVGPLISA